MTTKSPGYYRDLIESVISESVPNTVPNDWKIGRADLPSSMTYYTHIVGTIKSSRVEIVNAEVLVNSRAIYFYFSPDDQDVCERAKRIDYVGIAEKLKEILDKINLEPMHDAKWEVMDSDYGISFVRVPYRVINSLEERFISDPKGKKIILKDLLNMAKNTRELDFAETVDYLLGKGLDWPEIEALNKAYYHGLSESDGEAVITDWRRHVRFEQGLPTLDIAVQIPVNLQGHDMIITGIEMPMTSFWDGDIGIYFKEKDDSEEFNPYALLNDRDRPQLESIIGKMLGRRVTLERAMSCGEPMNGEGFGVRVKIPSDTFEDLCVEYFAANKKQAIKYIVNEIKQGEGTSVIGLVERLLSMNLGWPELEVLKNNIGF